MPLSRRAALQTVLLSPWALRPSLAQGKTRNVILVTADGFRWQDLFRGIDPQFMNEKAAGMAEGAKLRKRFWSEQVSERRERLMPFFWKTFAPRGFVLGNVDRGSSVQVSNGFRVSYPGYSEILTGRAQDAQIKGNDKIQNPTETILEYVRRKLNLSQRQVALFGSWDTFPFIGESKPGTVFINAGYQEAGGSPRAVELNRIQSEALTPWDSVRHDYVTLELAMDYLTREKPRLLYISLGETDDWAHGKRYDRVLQSIENFDHSLARIWDVVEHTPAYRGNTTMVVTTDHGRGSKLEDWSGHGKSVEGAQQIWIAAAGPDTPAQGELTNTDPAFQRDVAPTILQLLGLDYRDYTGVLGKPLPQAFGAADQKVNRKAN